MSDNIKVLIADDHPMIVEGITLSLQDMGYTIVGQTEDISEVLSIYEKTSPNVVILDIIFGKKKTGLDLLAELTHTDINANVIIYSQCDEDNIIIQAYKSGAKSYLLKEEGVEELIPAIEAVRKGEMYIPPSMGKKAVEFIMSLSLDNLYSISDTNDPKNILNEREFRVFCMISKGVDHKTIGEEINLSPRTIVKISNSIKEKLNFKKPIDFVICAAKYQYN